MYLNRPGFALGPSITLEGFGDASEEGLHGRFKAEGVSFVLGEIELNESRKHAWDRLAPKLS